MCYEKVMQKRRRRRVPRQKAARDDAGTEKEEFVVEIKVWLVIFEIFERSDKETYPDQAKDNEKD